MPLSFFNQLFETNRKGNRGTERARAGAPERVAGGGQIGSASEQDSMRESEPCANRSRGPAASGGGEGSRLAGGKRTDQTSGGGRTEKKN
jgi:hypothetical protein